jgi:hypothetical protein
MAGYLQAWETNEPDDVRKLFTDDAVYKYSPSDSNPLSGIDAIIAGWIKDRDERGTWTFDWHTIVETDEIAVIQGLTKYSGTSDYDNLWVVRFAPDGRATEFTEWYMDVAGQ